MTKFVPANENPKKLEADIKSMIERATAERNRDEKDGGLSQGGKVEVKKPILKRIMPDTPGKVALWAAVVAGIAGFAAYTILKKKQ